MLKTEQAETLTISQVTDLQVAVQADGRHGDEATTPKKEASPTIIAAPLPAEEPPMGQAGSHEERLAGH